MEGGAAVNGYDDVIDFSGAYESGKIYVAGEEIILPLKEKNWEDERDTWHTLGILTKAAEDGGLSFYLLWNGEAVVGAGRQSF